MVQTVAVSAARQWSTRLSRIFLVGFKVSSKSFDKNMHGCIFRSMAFHLFALNLMFDSNKRDRYKHNNVYVQLINTLIFIFQCSHDFLFLEKGCHVG